MPDENSTDSSALWRIANNPTSDIVYNSTTALWHCCYGSGSRDCSDPSLYTFDAPSPQQLLAAVESSDSSSSTNIQDVFSTIIASYSASTYSSLSVSSILTSSPSSTLDHISSALSISTSTTTHSGSSPLAAPSNSVSSGPKTCRSGSVCAQNTSTGLSTGAKVGIGIAVGLIGLCLAVSAFGVVLRRRKLVSRTNEDLVKEPVGGVHDVGMSTVYTGRAQAMELNTKQSLELDSTALVEMNAARSHELQ